MWVYSKIRSPKNSNFDIGIWVHIKNFDRVVLSSQLPVLVPTKLLVYTKNSITKEKILEI